MDDLVAWLRAQLNEDERVARAAGEADNGGPVWREGSTWFQDMLDPLPSQRRARPNYIPMITEEDVRHIARHDPARVLREVESKRALLGEHASDGGECRTCCGEEWRDVLWDGEEETFEWHRNAQPFPCRSLRLLALPYVDRPGYQESWRP